MLPDSPKHASRLHLAVLAIGMLCFAACENDLENIKKIANMSSGAAIDTTRGVDIIYSDSAVVKGRMLTPLLIKYSTQKPYDVMPDGIKVISFNKYGKEDGNIVADSAVQLEEENITKFYRNVIATTEDGTTLKTEELIWDQPKKIIYSSKPFELRKPNGDIMNGYDLMSDDKLEHPVWKSGTFDIEATDNMTQ